MTEENYLTKEGLEKLKAELNYLKTVKRKEIAKRLKHAASFGDLSENAAYHEAKETQAFLEGRILELEKVVKNARVLNHKKNSRLGIGSRVQLQKEKEGRVLKFQIVGETESDPPKGKISYQSPLGKALLGKTKGDIIELETIEQKIKYKILKVD